MARTRSKSRKQYVLQNDAAVIAAKLDGARLAKHPGFIKPALAALGGTAPGGGPLLVPGSEEFTDWARLLFFVPAVVGGAAGRLVT